MVGGGDGGDGSVGRKKGRDWGGDRTSDRMNSRWGWGECILGRGQSGRGGE